MTFDLTALADADPAARLVYADWLEDHGDLAQAEYIRITCRLDTLRPWEPGYTALRLRHEELFGRYGASWLGPLRALLAAGAPALDPVYHRALDHPLPDPGMALRTPFDAARLSRFFSGGLPRVLAATDVDFQACHELIRAKVPLSHLVLLLRDPVHPLPGSAFRALTHLTLVVGPDASLAQTLEVLAAADELRLRRLSVSTPALTAEDVTALAEVVAALDLEALEVGAVVGDNQVSVLAPALAASRLRSLVLPVATDRGVRSLVDDGLPPTLEALALRPRPCNHSAAVRLIAGAPGLAGLKRLDLSHMSLEAEAVNELAESTTLAKLEELNCSKATVARPARLALDRLAARPGLKMLDLSGCLVRPRAVGRLVSGVPVDGSLAWLSVYDTLADDTSFAGYARSGLPGALVSASFGANSLTDRTIRALAATPHPRLEFLLAGPGSATDSLASLLESASFPSLVALGARQVGAADARLLTRIRETPLGRQLRKLDVSVSLTPGELDGLTAAGAFDSFSRVGLEVPEDLETGPAGRRLQDRLGARLSFQFSHLTGLPC